jgi:hypothetical protein
MIPMMISIVVVVGSAVWVYLDATQHKIGGDVPAGVWATFVLLLWIIGLPAYLIQRHGLIEKAQQNPVEVKNRVPVPLVLCAIGAVGIGLVYMNYASGSLPACDNAQVMELAGQAVRNAPLVKLSGIQVKSVTDGGEASYDASAEKRTCRAMMETSLGQEVLKFTVEWHNKDKGEIFVQIVQ